MTCVRYVTTTLYRTEYDEPNRCLYLEVAEEVLLAANPHLQLVLLAAFLLRAEGKVR